MQRLLLCESETFMNESYNPRLFQSFFGVTLSTIIKLFSLLEEAPKITPMHMLWTLYFMKQNPTDLVNHYKADAKTWKLHVKETLGTLIVYLPDVIFYF
jgi:hypothetical protein